ncbi:MAG: hypothetical protein RLZZ437_2860 [Pseudomonadota bacterium]|jgi:hypothetical protein
MRMIALVLCLSACAAGPDVPVEALGEDTCNAAPWNARTGQPGPTGAEVPPGARVIAPGDAVTEDFSPTRLNIDIDDAGRILRAWCG